MVKENPKYDALACTFYQMLNDSGYTTGMDAKLTGVHNYDSNYSVVRYEDQGGRFAVRFFPDKITFKAVDENIGEKIAETFKSFNELVSFFNVLYCAHLDCGNINLSDEWYSTM